MRQYFGIAALVAAAGLSAPAFAQDSVSNNGGNLPGDALSPWAAGCASYVIDLSPVTTSQGNVFGVAPVLKASKMSSANFTALGSAASISPDVAQNVVYSRSSYSFWSTPGAGVNGEENNAGQTVMPSGQASRFGLVLSEFGTTDAARSYNGIIGALVNFDPANPNRLFVDRRMAAVNMAAPANVHSSQLGGVVIDANGNVYYRGDDFGTPANNPLVEDNIFRTRLADRNCGVLNFVSAAATLDATDRLVVSSVTTHGVGNLIPASVAGGSGLFAGSNFNNEYVYGGALGSMTSTTAHLDISTQHRGSFGGTSFPALGSGAYTLVTSANDPVNTADQSVINLTAVNAVGAVVAKKGFEIPLTVIDNDNGFAINYIDGTYESRHHTGSTAFRGGVGTFAVGNDQAGRSLIAATISENGFNGDFSNQIVVGRFTNPNGPVEWTFAAYVDQFNLGSFDAGKPIFDDMGNEIGQLVDLISVTGGSPTGPSISAPAIDSVGNVWFMGAVELYNRLPGGGSDFDGALIRAIYDPATFSYRLELVLEVGSVIAGQNSGRNYRIDFLGNAAANGTPSGNAFWSTSMADHAWNNTPTSGLDTADPITNGGAVVSTSITYDVNGDNRFNNPTSASFDPNFPADESYQVALYVGYYEEEAPCLADLAEPFGTLNAFDVFAFLGAYNTMNPIADFAAPFGTFNAFDVFAFLGSYNAGCP